MVRQTKRFKKGLNKKVLSAILAASMIMTSSSFAMAAPLADDTLTDETVVTNEVEETEVDGTLTDDAANSGVSTYSVTPEGDTGVDAQATDGQVHTDNYAVAFKDGKNSFVYTGEDIVPEINVYNKTTGTMAGSSEYQLYYRNNKNVPAEDAEEDETPYVEVVFTDASESVKLYFDITPLDISKATVKWENTDAFVYNGKVQHPQVLSVSVGDVELTADDYEVVGNRCLLVSAGSKSAMVKAKSRNFTGEADASGQTKSYTIDQQDLAKGNVTVSVEQVKFAGGSLTPSQVSSAVKVTDNDTKENVAFYIEWQDENGNWTSVESTLPKNIGTYPLRVYADGTGNFTKGSYVETSFEIVAENSLASLLKNAYVENSFGSDNTAVYTGKDMFPADFASALRSTQGLVYGYDFEIVNEKAEWINAGEYTLNIEGLNKYAGQTTTVTVKIAPKAITTDGKNIASSSGIEVTATQGTHPNSKNPSDVVVSISDSSIKDEDSNDKVLQEGVDYTYTTVMDEDNKGGSIVITGLGNYTTEYGTAPNNGTTLTQSITYNESTLDLNDPSISARIVGDYTYDGTTITLSTDDVEVIETDGSNTYKLDGRNFGFADNSNKINQAGKVLVKIEGKAPYSGTRVIELEVAGASFEETFDLADIDDVEYDDGKTVKSIKDAVVVTYKSTGGRYSDSHYSVKVYDAEGKELADSFKLNKGGVYTVEVIPNKGLYEGTLKTTFNVIGQNLKEANAKIADIDDQVYTSKAITPAVVVTVGNKTLEEGKDYTVSYSDNIKGGEATVTVTGINDYSGTIEKNFKITQADQSIEMTVAAQERDLANGSRTTGSNKCTLKLGFGMEDADLNLSYATSDKSVATVDGNGVITYQGVGECTITVTAKATDSCKEATLPITVKVGYPGTPTFTPSVTKNTAKKAFVVTSSTVRGADGFEVQYSIRSDFWRATTKDFSNTGSKLLRQTCKTVHSNRTYYVRVRAYQIVDGEKVYSKDWSPVKTVKTK